MDTLRLLTVIEEVIDRFEKAGWNRAHAYDTIAYTIQGIRPGPQKVQPDDED